MLQKSSLNKQRLGLGNDVFSSKAKNTLARTGFSLQLLVAKLADLVPLLVPI
jgi:hypothetical protein